MARRVTPAEVQRSLEKINAELGRLDSQRDRLEDRRKRWLFRGNTDATEKIGYRTLASWAGVSSARVAQLVTEYKHEQQLQESPAT